ncbi:MAG TPA: cell wall-binding repeat-containing protein [Egibacteraceae bacterium]|nr:cell wall-binding repeat-containing protein [Egibacteraceae bacterium]
MTFELARLCLPYGEAALPEDVSERDIRLLHFDGRRPRDITVRVNVRGDSVCGETDGFSPFALAVPEISAGPTLERLGSADAIRSASQVAGSRFRSGVPVVYVASGETYADVLALGPVATPSGGPILLTHRDQLPEATREMLLRLMPGRIVILGGHGAISAVVEQALRQFAADGVSRLSGFDRYETASALLAASFPVATPVVFIATGENFPDAIAGGAAAARLNAPVVLVQPDALPAASAAELARLRPERIYVLGGSGAVSAGVLVRLAEFASSSVERLAGADRFHTAVRISHEFFPRGASTVYLAAGEEFGAALAAVPAAARDSAPILLTRSSQIPAVVRDELERLRPERIVILGARGATAAMLREDVAELQSRWRVQRR